MALTGDAIGQSNRTIDGKGNNVAHPEWGSAGGEVVHNVPVAFEDGVSEPCRPNGMNTRELSNRLFHQSSPVFDQNNLNDFVWAFGQFVDHDIVLIHNFDPQTSPTEDASIIVPADDTIMSAGKIIPLTRSRQRIGSGTDINNPRTYDNEITAFLDASAVYGSDQHRADWLRSFEGGKLKTSIGNKLPWNTFSGEFNGAIDPNAPEMADDVGLSTKFFVAGDIRANENPLLLALHLLFVREHNRLCEFWLDQDSQLDPSNPTTDEVLFQRARRIVGAELQHIVYQEWLPTLGVELDEYSGYDVDVNPSISNAFSAALFRWGHTMINDNVLRLDLEGDVVASGNITLPNAFFSPLESLRFDIEAYLKGMGVQNQQALDCRLVSSVRNFLFENNPVLGGLDLAAINIQRGRERGLPDYNTLRTYYGLEAYNSTNQVTSNTADAQTIEDIYQDVWKIDPWVGMLAEDPVEGSIFGELLYAGVKDQFELLRDGDRFYYENDQDLSSEDMQVVSSTTLSNLIVRNTNIDCFQSNAFEATEHDNIPCFPYVSPADLQVSIAPNPVIDYTFISLFSSKETSANLRIVNELGQELSTQDFELIQGVNEIKVDFTNITHRGAYYVVIERGYDLKALKILKI